MLDRIVVCFMVVLVLFSISLATEAHAHSLFNSSEEFVGGYRVQIATLPEFPQIGEKSQIIFRVTDADFNEIDRFTMGLKIYFNGELIEEFSPQSREGSHWTIDYVFTQQGNNIVRVELYDMNEQGEVLSYVYNISTQSPFGFIFFSAIIFGAIMFTVIVGYIYMPKVLAKFRH